MFTIVFQHPIGRMGGGALIMITLAHFETMRSGAVIMMVLDSFGTTSRCAVDGSLRSLWANVCANALCTIHYSHSKRRASAALIVD